MNGTTAGLKDLTLTVDNVAATLNGAVNLPGTFLRYGGGNVFLNADSSASHPGGTWLGGGTLYFGTAEAPGYQTFVMNTTAKTGAGAIFVQAGAAIQFNDDTNLAATQTVEVRSSLISYGMLRLASDDALGSFRLRAGSAYGPQPVLSAGGVGQTYTRANNIGAGALSIGSVYTQPIDLAKLGDGLWYLGSASNNIGQQGSFNGSSLTAGLGNAYRLGAGGSTLNFGSDLVRSNVLTDAATGAANRLIVGSPVGGNSSVGNASGTVMLHTSQNYTGSTLVNRNSALDFRGRLSTPVFENYGTLVVSDTGTFVNAAGTANTASFLLRPGSELRFDNANGGLPDVSVASGRWHDSAPMTLDGATLRMTGSLTADVTENVGALTVRGGAAVLVQRGLQARYAGVNFASLSQAADVSVAGTSIIGNNGTLTLASLAGTASNANASFGTPLQLGGDERVTVSGGVSVTNGIAPAWAWNGQNPLLTLNADTNIAESVSASFLAYGSAGFVPAGWTAVTGGSGATTAIDGSTFAGPTDRAFINSTHSAANTTTLTNNLDVFALRVDSPAGTRHAPSRAPDPRPSRSAAAASSPPAARWSRSARH